MPSFTDISSIPLDKFQMQKNPTPKQDPTNNQYFVYIDFPPQGYPIQFKNMNFNSTGKAHNILNFGVSSSVANKPFPILYFASNGKFKMSDIQSYIPVGIQITQKIHNSNVMGTSTNDDLQMIFECNQNGGSKVLFIHILLTIDTQNKKNGDDFNKIFDNLTYMDQLETNTKNFETQNLKPPPFKMNFTSGIVNQFGVDPTDPIKNSMKCFYFLDTNQHTHVLLQTPIPIHSENFVKLQAFYKNTGLAMNPFAIYGNSKLTPDASLPITNDVLLSNMEALNSAQETPPQTIEAHNNSKDKEKKDEQAKKNVDAANKANEGFIGSYKEGLKTMNCRVSNSSKALVATLVGDEQSNTTALDGYQLIIFIAIFIGIIFIIFSILQKTLFFIPIKIKEPPVNIRILYDMIIYRKRMLTIIKVVLLVAGICFFIPLMLPNVKPNVTFPCTIIGIICICSIFIIGISIRILNNQNNRNRYNYVNSIIKDPVLATYKFDKLNLDNNNDDKFPPNSREEFIIFLHQCMSFFFGDTDWYKDKSDKDNSKIKKIEIDKDDDGKEVNPKSITVTLDDSTEYKYGAAKEYDLPK